MDRAKKPIEVSILCYVFWGGCNKGCKSRNSLIYTLICGERGL